MDSAKLYCSFTFDDFYGSVSGNQTYQSPLKYMNNKHWQTNLGGAIGIVGTSLIGIGIVPQLSGVPSKFLTYTAIAGFILSALGRGLTALFAADASTVNNVASAVDRINLQGSNVFAKPALDTQPPVPDAFKPANINN